MHEKPVPLKMLAAIVDRDKIGKITEILREEQVHVHFITFAEGTAASEMMEMLGLSSKEKGVVFCIEPACRTHRLLTMLSARLELHKPGKGIAFTAKLTGVNRAVLEIVTQDKKIDETGGERTMETSATSGKYGLILSVIDHGYAETLMEAAKSAGARGGTVLHGRKIGVDGEAAPLLGMEIQMEKQIVAILAPKEQKRAIMQAISSTCGITTEAQGVIFSLPIDEIEGLGK